jgi:hypothetical protein
MKLAFLIALLLAASPVAAQTSQVQQPLGTGGVTNNSPLTDTGVICQQEMVATFCNVASSPNSAGYGSNGGAAATSAGITTPLSRYPGQSISRSRRSFVLHGESGRFKISPGSVYRARYVTCF